MYEENERDRRITNEEELPGEHGLLSVDMMLKTYPFKLNRVYEVTEIVDGVGHTYRAKVTQARLSELKDQRGEVIRGQKSVKFTEWLSEKGHVLNSNLALRLLLAKLQRDRSDKDREDREKLRKELWGA